RIKYVGSLDDVILSVIYTRRGKKYRIISARCASKIERRLYHENKK
ncbi:MAG: BrnT family toxin, partial [Neisseriales bacterium]